MTSTYWSKVSEKEAMVSGFKESSQEKEAEGKFDEAEYELLNAFNVASQLWHPHHFERKEILERLLFLHI